MIDCNCIYGRCEQIQAKKEEIERLQARVEALEAENKLLRDLLKKIRTSRLRKFDAWKWLMVEIDAATDQEDTCRHEWCDIGTGGQYCRLCDARQEDSDE